MSTQITPRGRPPARAGLAGDRRPASASSAAAAPARARLAGDRGLRGSRAAWRRHPLAPSGDPAELVAVVLRARRRLLIGAHRHRLRYEDLEDCLAQAALELVANAREGATFAGPAHVARVLEQRFVSRIHDRRRALEGRSTAQATFEHALADGELLLDDDDEQIADPRADVDGLVECRQELRRLRALLQMLSPDQRLVLECQALLDMDCGTFCAQYGWSPEKYRKVAQRGRARLRELSAES